MPKHQYKDKSKDKSRRLVLSSPVKATVYGEEPSDATKKVYGTELMNLLKKHKQDKNARNELLSILKNELITKIDGQEISIKYPPSLSQRIDKETQSALGVEFFNAIDQGDFDFFHAYLESGLSINQPHPKHQMAPLHLAAGTSRYFSRHLINSGKCDYTLRDKWGRFAADVSVEGPSELQGVERLLYKKTGDQLREKYGLSIVEYEKKFPHPAKG